MGHIFSRQKTRVTEQDNALLQMKQQRDQLKRYQRRINQSIDKDTAAIRQLVHTDKNKALLLLKKKKYQDNLLVESEQHLTKVESLIKDVEFAQIQIQVLNGLKEGNKALKQLNSLMKLEDVEQIMSDAREAQEYQEELTNILAGNLSSEDTDEIAEELEQLLTEDLPTDFPEVPKQTIAIPKEKKHETVRDKANHDPNGDRHQSKPKTERVAVAGS